MGEEWRGEAGIGRSLRAADCAFAVHSEARHLVFGRIQSKSRFLVAPPAWLIMPTDKAARQILRAIARGKREAIITGHGKALVFLERFMPWVIRAVSRKIAAGRGGYRQEAKSG